MITDCHPLLEIVVGGLQKAEKDFAEIMESSGFVNSDLASAKVEELTNTIEELIDDFVQEAAESAAGSDDPDSLKDYTVDGKSKQELSEGISDAMADVLLGMLVDTAGSYFQNKHLSLSTVSYEAVDSVFNLIETYSTSITDRVASRIHEYLNDCDDDSKEKSEIAEGLMTSTFVSKAMNAKTYIVSAMLAMHSIAQHEAIMQNPAATGRMWKHTSNKKVTPRQHHKKLDGTVVGKDEQFELNPYRGRVYKCFYPRELNLPPSETIHCHCMEIAVIDDDILNSDIDEQVAAQEAAIEQLNKGFLDSANEEAIERAKKWLKSLEENKTK